MKGWRKRLFESAPRTCRGAPEADATTQYLVSNLADEAEICQGVIIGSKYMCLNQNCVVSGIVELEGIIELIKIFRESRVLKFCR